MMLNSRNATAIDAQKSALWHETAELPQRYSDQISCTASTDSYGNETVLREKFFGQFEHGNKIVTGNEIQTNSMATSTYTDGGQAKFDRVDQTRFERLSEFHDATEMSDLRLPLHVRGRILLTVAVLPWVALYLIFANMS